MATDRSVEYGAMCTSMYGGGEGMRTVDNAGCSCVHAVCVVGCTGTSFGVGTIRETVEDTVWVAGAFEAYGICTACSL